MRKNKILLILAFYLLLTLFLFRPYFFKRQIPLPANLLVSVYSPFRQEKDAGNLPNVPFKPMGEDIVRLFFPYKHFTLEALQQGKLPLWNPYVFSGNPHLATYQAAVLYPLNVIFLILGLADGWSWLIIIQPILTGWFTYLFLRSLKLSNKSSFFGSLVFTLSGWMVCQWEESIIVEHSFLWLPLALYASNLIWQQSKKFWPFLLLTTPLVFSLLAGFMQITIYLLLVLLTWNIFLCWQEKNSTNRKNSLIYFFLGLCAALGLTAVQWLPTLEAYNLSLRGSTSGKFLFEQFLMPLNHIATLIAPDYWGNSANFSYFYGRSTYHDKMIYFGIIPLVLVIYLYLQKTKPQINFWKILGLIFFSLGLALPTSWIWFYLKIPVLSTYHPGRNFAVATFIFSILAAYALEALQKNKQWKIWLKALLVPTLGLILLWLWVSLAIYIVNQGVEATEIYKRWFRYSTISLRNLILPTFFLFSAWFAAWMIKKKPQLLFGYCTTLTLISGFYFANKYLYFSNRNLLYPQLPVINKLKELSGVNRVWGYGDAYFEPSILTYYGLYSTEGYDALYSRRYGELLSAITANGKIAASVARNDANLKPVLEKDFLFKDNFSRERLMSLLGVKYILETKQKRESQTGITRLPEARQLNLVWEDENWRIWENLEALPRAFLADEYLVGRNQTQIIETIFAPDFDPSKTVILEESPQISKETSRSIVSAEILDYEPELIKIKVSTDRARFLFLSDNYFPGWIAEIDGIKAKIYRANYTFRSVLVPAGVHEIIFRYQPLSFKVGAIISLMTVSFLLWLKTVLRWVSKS